MKLSKLVYLCVKNAIYYDDSSFLFESFLEGKFNDSPDYATNINNVFTPLNEAIARLSDLERIPYRVEECNVKEKIIDLLSLTSKTNVKEVINVAEVTNNGSYQKLAHRPFGIGKVFVTDYFNSFNKIYIEYKEDIPSFDEYNLPRANAKGEIDYEGGLDLKDYGITDSMCNYIIEYVVGRLLEPISADLSNMHISRAESYFANIKPVSQAFPQQLVANLYRVGD